MNLIAKLIPLADLFRSLSLSHTHTKMVFFVRLRIQYHIFILFMEHKLIERHMDLQLHMILLF